MADVNAAFMSANLPFDSRISEFLHQIVKLCFDFHTFLEFCNEAVD